jgi:uncharacterized membrane protein
MPEDENDPMDRKRSLRDYGVVWPTIQNFVAAAVGSLLYMVTFILVALLISALPIFGWLATTAVLGVPLCVVAGYIRWVIWRRDKGYWL